jgi:hypothetical protein
MPRLFTWIRRATVYVWELLAAMSEGSTSLMLDHYDGRLARLEARISALEAGQTSAPKPQG